jgi:hypothetical protein
MTHRFSLLAAAAAIVAFGAGAASAQTPDTRIIVHGAINDPAHVQPVTDGRDDAVPEMPVVYENPARTTPALPASAQTRGADQTPAQPASTGGTNLGQTFKSQ